MCIVRVRVRVRVRACVRACVLKCRMCAGHKFPSPYLVVKQSQGEGDREGEEISNNRIASFYFKSIAMKYLREVRTSPPPAPLSLSPLSLSREDTHCTCIHSLLYALCSMLYALCPMPYALCPMLYALCPMPYALCPMLSLLCAISVMCYLCYIGWVRC